MIIGIPGYDNLEDIFGVQILSVDGNIFPGQSIIENRSADLPG